MKSLKLLALILAILTLTACSKSDPAPLTPGQTETNEPAVTETEPTETPQTARAVPSTTAELTKKWTELGVYDGQLMTGSVTKAELAHVINVIFEFSEPQQALYFDVSSSNQYYSDIQAVAAAGIITSDSENYEPDTALTRQEAIYYLAKVFCGELSGYVRTGFSDDELIDDSLRPACAYFEERGWIDGYELNPEANLTWSDLLAVLEAMLNDIVTDSSETVSGDYPSGVVINGETATISNATINGDVFLPAGVRSIAITDSVIFGNIYVGRGQTDKANNSTTIQITGGELKDLYLLKRVTMEFDSFGGTLYALKSSEIHLGNSAYFRGMSAKAPVTVTGRGLIEKAVIKSAAAGTSFEIMPSEYIDVPNGMYSSLGNGLLSLLGNIYYVDESGRIAHGFVDVGEKRYYFNSDGEMVYGHAVIDLKSYYFGFDGGVHTGWLKEDDSTGYYGESGERVTGLAEIDGNSYIFSSEGILLFGMLSYDGDRYYAGEDGALFTGILDYEGETYYADDGILQSGIIEVGENLYYFDEESFKMLKSTEIEGYTIDENGILTEIPDSWKISSGDEELDAMLDEIIAEITTEEMTLDEKMYAAYKWTANNVRYRATPIDLSNGFTEALVAEHGKSTLETRRGACEHFAIVNALLFNRLGVKTILIEGYRYSTYYYTWDEHTWLLAKLEDLWYHFDTLYEYQHTGVDRSVYMKTDEEMSSHHRWETGDYPVCDGVTVYNEDDN